ncbi:MAG: universal stress protein [Gammaproteobacteria bacterium]|nr:universal stress protein [Gammaproteobacteria bacterium]
MAQYFLENPVMSYKSLLAYIEPSSRNRPVMETGLRLASVCEAHLTALHAHVPTPIAYPEYSEFPMVNDLQTLRHEDEEAKNFETRLKAEFNDLAGRSGAVSVEWRFVGGDLVETLALHARYADLLVMRQHHPQTHIRGLLSNLVYGGLIRRRPC